MGLGRSWGRVEVELSNRIDLAEDFASLLHDNRGIRQYGVTGRWYHVLMENSRPCFRAELRRLYPLQVSGIDARRSQAQRPMSHKVSQESTSAKRW